MKYIITSLLILTVWGCQTAKIEPPMIPRACKEIVSVRVEQNFHGYSVSVKWAAYRLDENNKVVAESRDVLSSPIVTGKPSKWMRCNVGVKPKGLNSNISYLIDGEIVNTPVLAGINLISKIVPFNDNDVHVKGIFASSAFDGNRKLTSMSLPIDVICTLGEEKILYEKEIKFEPVR